MHGRLKETDYPKYFIRAGKHLYLTALGKRVELVGVDYDITETLSIEVTPAIATILGTYKAEFHYILPTWDLSMRTENVPLM